MKNNNKKAEFDEIIGFQPSRELTKKEHDEIKDFRRELYEKRSTENKVDDILTGFRFTLKSYVENETPKDVIHLGEFLNSILKQINIKKGNFAEYINISPRNINKYFNGERKFNIDHALKLENMFDVHAETLLEIQLKNELLKAKISHKGEYDKYNLKDLLPG
ncbi:MAG: helix-turn-helix domain-containing protein [Crocinitomicaceae bacterium]|nr:helix-turn-helix domain-containing protein [Flavobacteriales bacterium]NQZ34790.1 helix-turn-helix domain-containing protein [Crocinitomicaceae bacterium]